MAASSPALAGGQRECNSGGSFGGALFITLPALKPDQREVRYSGYIGPARQLTAGARPPSICLRGATIRIDIHDEWYLNQCSKLMDIAVRAHPDRSKAFAGKGGGRGAINKGVTYRYALKALFIFKASQQKKWYSPLGLVAPRFKVKHFAHGKNKPTTVGGRLRLKPRTGLATLTSDWLNEIGGPSGKTKYTRRQAGKVVIMPEGFGSDQEAA